MAKAWILGNDAQQRTARISVPQQKWGAGTGFGS
jgi:hypothetical protein